MITKVDLDTPSLMQYDPVTSGVKFNNAEITITAAPGLGISKIDNLTILDIKSPSRKSWAQENAG